MDSRLQGYNGAVTHSVLPLERTYCANCGKPWGWASTESSAMIAAAEIIVFCQECFENLNDKGERIPNEEMLHLGLCEENLREGIL